MKRLVMFSAIVAVVWTAENWWVNSQQPELSARLALRQFNGGDEAAQELRSFQWRKDRVHLASMLGILVSGAVLLGPLARRVLRLAASSAWWQEFVRRWRGVAPLLLGLSLAFGTGCLRSYDRPEHLEIDTSETGFLIPLEGDGSQQAKFQSEEYLAQRKVAAKRVQITHRWSQEGRLHNDGRWIPTVRLVKVNRSPVTREWMSMENAAGAASRRPGLNDKAIWIESADSVGFSMGFTCTAFISEEDASRFLYWYPSGSLAEVMDREVRGRIQQVAAEVAARYPLDSLRSKKQEISDAVKKDLTSFFATRGITVTTVGMFGGMTYENPEIQRSIDQTFIAQQQKVVAEARFDAQKKENERLELEAEGLAEKERRQAMGLADARKTAAGAEAESIRQLNRAAEEAQTNPLLMQLKVLDVEKARIEKWDGHYPQWWMSGTAPNGGPNLLLQMPAFEAMKK
jgi:hypothetical protein